MKKILIIIALLTTFASQAQDTPKVYTGDFAPMINRGYQFKSLKVDSSLWMRGNARFDDTVAFGKKAYTATPPHGDSSYEVPNTLWIKQNISPGIPGQFAAAWSTTGNASPQDPNPYRLGMQDSTPLSFITNNMVRMILPENGIVRRPITPARSVVKAIVIDTTTKRIYYDDFGSGGMDTGYIDIAAVGDSGFYLLKNNGKRDTVIIRTGGGGGGSFDTTTIYQELGKRVEYTDTATMLLPYLKVIDTTGKWVHGWAQFGDTTRLYKGEDSISIVSGSSPPNFPTVDDTLTANRQLFIDTYNLLFKSQNNNLFTLNNTGLSYSGSNWSNAINNSYQEYLQGFGSTYSMFRLTTSNSRMYSQTSGVNYSYVDVAPTIITLRAKDSIQITSGIAEESLEGDMKVLVRKSNNTVIEVDPSEFGGGGATPDTIFTKFPLRVDTTGVNDSLKLKYPPNSVAVNLTNDTADVQFLPISSFRANLLGYREYVALLYYSPSPTDTIIAEVIYNDLGVDIDWLYDDVGNYSATYVGGTVDVSKISISFSSNATGYSSSAGSSYHTLASVASTGGFSVYTRALQLTPSPEFVAVNSILQKEGDDGSTFITIRIYN